MKITKTTPILCVASIEESLPFWTDVLGYEKTVEVPHNGKLGFVMLQKDGSEIMLQTHPSMVDDLPAVAKHVKVGSICLYSDVDSIEKTLASLKTVKPLVPPRTTPYGAKEIFVQDPDGNVLGFAEFKK
ncbi:MAG: VOC family protein [Deltaproteobacteria bacterium]|nr:VOC family protein [Deltaproteobacteria bacterium]